MATIAEQTAENLIALQQAKESIKIAITNKGQDLTNVPFTEYGAKIEAIQTGSEEDKFKKLINGEDFEITENDLSGITSIPEYAFYYKLNLTAVTLPNTITEIGKYAFAYCKGLTDELVIPDGVTSIGNYAFYNSENITKIVIPDSVTYIGSDATSGTNKLTEIYFYPNKLSCNMKEYSSARITSVKFYIKSLSDYLSNDIMGGSILSYCHTKTLYIDGVPTYDLVIPSQFENFNGGYFPKFTTLKSVKFEGNVTNIVGTFNGCNAITLYDFRNNTVVPTLNSKSSIGYKSGCKIIVPDALYDEWIVATNWSSLTNFICKASEYVEG